MGGETVRESLWRPALGVATLMAATLFVAGVGREWLPTTLRLAFAALLVAVFVVAYRLLAGRVRCPACAVRLNPLRMLRLRAGGARHAACPGCGLDFDTAATDVAAHDARRS